MENFIELSELEQIDIPKGRIQSILFNLHIIVRSIIYKVKGYSNLTKFEKVLINEDKFFFNNHILKHVKYNKFEEFGNIYNLFMTKGDLKYDKLNERPILIFIHGLGGNLHQFDEQFNFFYKNFDVLSFDLPGSGNSELEDDNYPLSLENFTKFVLEFIKSKKFENKNFILIGHSYGTQVILNLIKHLDSSSIKKIVLIAPPKFPSSRNYKMKLILKLFTYFPIIFDIFRKFDRINNINGNSMRRLFSVSKYNEIDTFLKFKQFKFNLQTNSKNFLNHLINWKPIELDELIRSVEYLKLNPNFQKLLIIDGEEDQVTKNGGLSYKIILGQDVDYQIIPEAGHNLIIDSYQELNEMIQENISTFK